MKARNDLWRFYIILFVALSLCGCAGRSTDQQTSQLIDKVASISLWPLKSTIEIGQTVQLTASPRDSNGNMLKTAVSWASSNPSIASVSAAGLVTAITEGGPIAITVSGNGVTTSMELTVSAIGDVAGVVISPFTAVIAINQTVQLSATPRNSNGASLTDAVSWASSNPSIASVSATGLVTAVAEGGPILIFASSKGATSNISVVVSSVPVSDMSLAIQPETVEAGQSAQAVATLKDAAGATLKNRFVSWSSSAPDIATVSPQGRIIARNPGQVTITAICEGKTVNGSLLVVNSQADTRQQTIDAMMQMVPAVISNATSQMKSTLSANPNVAAYINSIISMLQTPTLNNDIVSEKFFEASFVASMNGRRIPIVAVFPKESLREDARKALGSVQLAIPIIERFLNTPFPSSDIRIWYGFIVGASGGGGTINTEAERVYETRRTMADLISFSYESMIDHEMSHSYIYHESLNQFLELYASNYTHTNSKDIQSWIYLRNYIPFRASNDGVSALLDICQLIGWDAMESAYRTILPLKPPYGKPLPDEDKQAFVDAAPFSVKSQVQTIINRVIY